MRSTDPDRNSHTINDGRKYPRLTTGYQSLTDCVWIIFITEIYH